MATKTRFTLGREHDCDIAIADSSVSRLHAEISLLDGEKLLIRDCNSRNGTEIIHGEQARRITEDTANASDTLRFGTVTVAASEIVTAIRMLSAAPKEPPDKPEKAEKPQEKPHIQPPPTPPPPDKHAAANAKKSEPQAKPVAKTELIRCDCGAIRAREARCAECGAM